MDCRYIIQGYTLDGRKFRPSDWIDRVASMAATYHSQRLVYSENLHPELYEGQKCLILCSRLKETNESMYDYVLNFVKVNKLKMIELCEITEANVGV